LPQVVEGVLQAMTFARQEEVKAWEQEYTPCEHTLCLEQESSRKIESQGELSGLILNQGRRMLK
jgi:ubiquitin carboxyl-terminal hydrolase 5/13